MDQLVEIIKVLGTPTREEIYSMNPNYTEFKFPKITAHPWSKVFSKRMPPDAVDLVRCTWQHAAQQSEPAMVYFVCMDTQAVRTHEHCASYNSHCGLCMFGHS